MPSRLKTATAKSAKTSVSSTAVGHQAFIPLVIISFLVWLLYRLLFRFDVWFDESIGKALFFGGPVWLYVTMTQSKSIPATFSVGNLKQGLLQGLAVGGVFGFAVSLVSLWRRSSGVMPLALWDSPLFWGEFGLALLTAFWETLFFYCWIMVVIREKFKNWSLLQQAMVVGLIFLVFHLPNIFLRFTGMGVIAMVGMLGLFGIGQAFLFARRANGYTLVMSQAIWGMALLVQFF